MGFIRRLVPAAIRRRYAVKFGIVLLLLGITIGGIGFVATAEITGEVEQRVHDERAVTAEHEVKHVELWHDQNVQTAYAMTWSDAIGSDDPEVIESALGNWEADSATYAVSVVDIEEDVIVASTVDGFRGESAAELEVLTDDAYEQATSRFGFQQRTWVSEPYLSDAASSSDRPVITYAISPSDVDDRVVVYTVELESYVDQVGTEDHVTTMILDENDRVLFDSAQYGEQFETFGLEYGDESIPAAAREEGTISDRVERSPTGALEHEAYGFDSDDYVVSASRVLDTGWVVVTHESTDQAYGFVNAVDEYGTYATLGGILVIGVMGALLGRSTAVSIDRLTRKAAEMEEGDLEVDLETERIDNIGRLYEGFDSMRVALREQIDEAEAAREEAERERERIAEINAHLEARADAYSDVMEAAADGDLTARMDADSESENENEAMEAIAAEFNAMLAEIERTVAELSAFATQVATASEQVTASSEEVQSASEQVTESIQEISDGAERQNSSLQSVTQEMSGLSTTTEEIAASSNEVADIAERTVRTGQGGQEAAQEAIAAMHAVEAEAEDAVDEMRRLEEEVGQIDQLLSSISEIAHQTNMLALNANIEASRSGSGEDEEGFAVVAQEVKILSEDVADAADEAERRLEAIRERTEQSTAEVEGTSDHIQDAGERVQEAVDALEEIADLARETNVGVQEISAATEEQAASTQEVVAIVDDAATISEETTTEAENVAAAAEEQTTALTEVTEAASGLSAQSTQLSAGLDRFDTGVDEEAVAAASLAPSIGDEEGAGFDPETGAGGDDADDAQTDVDTPRPTAVAAGDSTDGDRLDRPADPADGDDVDAGGDEPDDPAVDRSAADSTSDGAGDVAGGDAGDDDGMAPADDGAESADDVFTFGETSGEE